MLGIEKWAGLFLVMTSALCQSAVVDVRVQFQDSSLTRVSSENWTSAALPNPNVLQTVSTLVDFNSGIPTEINLEASGWETRVGHSQSWLEEDFVSWILPEVTTGGWRIRINNTQATIAFVNVPSGRYNVEFLATAGGANSPQGVSLNGEFTTTTFRGSEVSSSNYIARDLGRNAMDWFIWEDVAAEDGRLELQVERFGFSAEVSAVRLVSVPEPSALLLTFISIFCASFGRLRS